MTTDVMIRATMPDLRKAVIAELKRREWSTYHLVQQLKGRGKKGGDIPAATVYDFLRGEHPINSDYLGAIFDVLGIGTTAKAKAPR